MVVHPSLSIGAILFLSNKTFSIAAWWGSQQWSTALCPGWTGADGRGDWGCGGHQPNPPHLPHHTSSPPLCNHNHRRRAYLLPLHHHHPNPPPPFLLRHHYHHHNHRCAWALTAPRSAPLGHPPGGHRADDRQQLLRGPASLRWSRYQPQVVQDCWTRVWHCCKYCIMYLRAIFIVILTWAWSTKDITVLPNGVTVFNLWYSWSYFTGHHQI